MLRSWRDAAHRASEQAPATPGNIRTDNIRTGDESDNGRKSMIRQRFARIFRRLGRSPHCDADHGVSGRL